MKVADSVCVPASASASPGASSIAIRAVPTNPAKSPETSCRTSAVSTTARPELRNRAGCAAKGRRRASESRIGNAPSDPASSANIAVSGCPSSANASNPCVGPASSVTNVSRSAASVSHRQPVSLPRMSLARKSLCASGVARAGRQPPISRQPLTVRRTFSPSGCARTHRSTSASSSAITTPRDTTIPRRRASRAIVASCGTASGAPRIPPARWLSAISAGSANDSVPSGVTMACAIGLSVAESNTVIGVPYAQVPATPGENHGSALAAQARRAQRPA